MHSFKGYVNENFKELIKISVAIEGTYVDTFEALLKKENFGYNGPMDQSRYDRLGLDEFIIVGPNTPVMKWVSKNKKYIIIDSNKKNIRDVKKIIINKIEKII